MVHDFKDSYEQRRWEYAVSAYFRAHKTLELCAKWGLDEHSSYWKQSILRLEKEYPGKLKYEPNN